MRTDRGMKCISAMLIGPALLLAGCMVPLSRSTSGPYPAVFPAPRGAGGFPVIELPVPKKAARREYLGVAEGKSFTVADIGAEIVVIELFSMYCPHCQREAPRVNELYDLVQASPELKRKVRIIGIGVGNSPFETGLFRRKYRVPFPLFADRKRVVGKALKIPGTPTFAAVTIEGGVARKIVFHPGGFGDPRKFLEEVLSAAGEK